MVSTGSLHALRRGDVSAGMPAVDPSDHQQQQLSPYFWLVLTLLIRLFACLRVLHVSMSDVFQFDRGPLGPVCSTCFCPNNHRLGGDLFLFCSARLYVYHRTEDGMVSMQSPLSPLAPPPFSPVQTFNTQHTTETHTHTHG